MTPKYTAEVLCVFPFSLIQGLKKKISTQGLKFLEINDLYYLIKNIVETGKICISFNCTTVKGEN